MSNSRITVHHYKASKSYPFTLLEVKSVSPSWGCAIYIYLKINIVGFLCFSLKRVLPHLKLNTHGPACWVRTLGMHANMWQHDRLKPWKYWQLFLYRKVLINYIRAFWSLSEGWKEEQLLSLSPAVSGQRGVTELSSLHPCSIPTASLPCGAEVVQADWFHVSLLVVGDVAVPPSCQAGLQECAVYPL